MDYLFSTGHLGQALLGQQSKMGAAAAALQPAQVLGRGVDEVSAELAEEYHVNPLMVHWDQITAEQSESNVDVSGDWNRFIRGRSQPFLMSGTTVTYFVPFEGDEELFGLQPSTFTTTSPEGRARDGELRFSFTGVDPSAEQVRGDLERNMGLIKRYIDWVNLEVEAFNKAVPAQARAAVEMRHQKILRDGAIVASLGVPMRRREHSPTTYVAPSIKRKPTALPSQSTASRRVSAPEPVLLSDEYDHILDIVRNMVLVMERSPQAFVKMAEEDLRQHFLVQLNGAYEGQATGETFNFEGKTDILVRESGRNVFIAECKFWHGSKALSTTVDQLLGYTSWRDTKTAIFVFNRGRELSKVLVQIPEILQSHPNFVRELPSGDETKFRVVLRHKDDPERELTLTVLVFEVPA